MDGPRARAEELRSLASLGAKLASLSGMNPSSKEADAKHESAKKPGKDDVHEQREQGQPQEGTVREATPKAPLPQD